jgi:hypothetical protein
VDPALADWMRCATVSDFYVYSDILAGTGFPFSEIVDPGYAIVSVVVRGLVLLRPGNI